MDANPEIDGAGRSGRGAGSLGDAGRGRLGGVDRLRRPGRREALERQRGGARVFATLDAVARCLSSAGLSMFSVNLGQGEEPP